ncbi:serine/threonine-protein kinase AFC1-like isoform X3 [Magnolia sinica]|uniref:serine/threonine-protein kinase AFC1-like isoform X3 n=1 Tax=Magnolia sinica TaxID=86752 RepID=UPI00265A3380|nr:serine/threonine-protein kinase AFC1-like isoform X3 [Magnolia sinica]
METQWITEFPHTNMDKRPRKRPRLTWDMPPQVPKALPTVGNATIPNHNLGSSLYYKGAARNGSPPWRNDDKDGHYMFAIGEHLTSRYRILSKMGEGTFGQVLECWDMEKKEAVAIKIVRSINKYREAAMIEIDVLQNLAKHDIGGTRCVQIRNWFDYRNHICIVFEKLGPSLYDFLRKNSYRSFPIDLVRELGRQLLESVAFMHDLRLIHTDLKPENILLVSAEYVKVPDYKGEALFQTHENLEHLAMMERVLGPLPQQMVNRADRRAEKYFRRGTRLDWPEGATSRESMRAVWKLPRLQNLIMQHVDHSAGDLIDLLQGLLCYDPTDRLKARDALRHPFFTRDLRRGGYSL